MRVRDIYKKMNFEGIISISQAQFNEKTECLPEQERNNLFCTMLRLYINQIEEDNK